jgi:hypothetical protein
MARDVRTDDEIYETRLADEGLRCRDRMGEGPDRLPRRGSAHRAAPRAGSWVPPEQERSDACGNVGSRLWESNPPPMHRES